MGRGAMGAPEAMKEIRHGRAPVRRNNAFLASCTQELERFLRVLCLARVSINTLREYRWL